MGCGCIKAGQRKTTRRRAAPPPATGHVRFRHGLGDCALFALSLPSYIGRGVNVAVDCDPDKAPLFRAVGARAVPGGLEHPYLHPDDPLGNKLRHNLNAYPMPTVDGDLWEEVQRLRPSLERFVDGDRKKLVDEWIGGRKVVAFHPQGNTSPEWKNIDHELQASAAELLTDAGFTVLFLDWDSRTARPDRAVHLDDTPFRRPDIPTLWYVLTKSSAVIGVDSGVQHLASHWTDTPVVGVWTDNRPERFAVPAPYTVHLARRGERQEGWNVVEYGGKTPTADDIVRLVQAGPVVQQRTDDLTPYAGRLGKRATTTLEALRRLQTIQNPTVLETGCIRQLDDWGAGYSTVVYGDFLKRHGGKLVSVDLDGNNVAFARRTAAGLPVEVVQADSRDFLRTYSGPPLALAYLDSADTYVPGFQECCWEEARLVLPHLRPDGIILIDDTPDDGGKGGLAIPFLKAQGWQVVMSGHQVLMARQ